VGKKFQGHEGIEQNLEALGRDLERLTQASCIARFCRELIKHVQFHSAFEHPGGPKAGAHLNNGFGSDRRCRHGIFLLKMAATLICDPAV
jgi:hypothetical protein